MGVLLLQLTIRTPYAQNRCPQETDSDGWAQELLWACHWAEDLWRRSGDAQFSDGHCRGLWWNLMHTLGFHSEPLLVCWFGFSCKLVFTHHHKLRIAFVSQMRTTFIRSAHMETGQWSTEIIMVSGQHRTSAHRYVHEITERVVLQAGLLRGKLCWLNLIS